MNNIVNDLSTLTTVDKKVFNKLNDIVTYVVNNAVEESMLEDKDITEVDIGIGTLIIKHTSDEIRYKFIPSAKFDKSIVNTIVNKKSSLEVVLEQTLVNKLTNTYKDLI